MPQVRLAQVVLKTLKNKAPILVGSMLLREAWHTAIHGVIESDTTE